MARKRSLRAILIGLLVAREGLAPLAEAAGA